jgi:hypothetical protein
MASDQTLIKELVRAKMINAKREKEAAYDATDRTAPLGECYHNWEGQETMAKQILTILESA